MTAQPVYFSSGDRTLFGWLHPTHDGGPAGVGVVICKPFGFEAMCAHQSMRAFAEAFAARGIPCLRFDYAGTGDSDDPPESADQVRLWVQDIGSAMDELRRSTGVGRICLLGIRLGALLAVLAAREHRTVDGLALVAPVMSGKRYLRELRNFALAAARSPGSPPPLPNMNEPQPVNSPPFEVSGFLLHAPTVNALSGIDLLTEPVPRVSEALVIDRDDLPAAQDWPNRLTAAGARVRQERMPGFVPMMRPPNLSVVPTHMVRTACDWLLGSNLVIPIASREPHTPARHPLVLPGDGGTARTEQAVMLRTDPPLFGIVTLPDPGEVRRRGVVLLNSGGDHHIGPRRLYVDLARAWAGHGYTVLRLDLSGLGDSTELPGQARNEVFPANALEDIGLAVRFMRNECGVADIALAGLCSGAYHALRAAVERLPVNRILMVNPLNFLAGDGTDLTVVQPWEVTHKPVAYLTRARSLDSWRQLLSGRVSLWRIGKIYLIGAMVAMKAALRGLARRIGVHVKSPLLAELSELDARGVHIVMVFSRGEPGITLLETQSGVSLAQLSARFRLITIDDADHEFTRRERRMTLTRILSEELYSLPAGWSTIRGTHKHSDRHSRRAPVDLVASTPKR